MPARRGFARRAAGFVSLAAAVAVTGLLLSGVLNPAPVNGEAPFLSPLSAPRQYNCTTGSTAFAPALAPDVTPALPGEIQGPAPVAFISTGPEPRTPVLDPVTGDLYVPNFNGASVTVIDAATNGWAGQIPVGTAPVTPVFDPANNLVYVPNSGSGNVSVVSTDELRAVAAIPVGSIPSTPAFDPAAGLLIVANAGSNTVSIISTATESVVATVPVGAVPGSPIYDPADGWAWVPDTSGDNLTLVNVSSDTVAGSVVVGDGPSTPAYDPSDDRVVVASYGNATVTVLNASSAAIVRTLTVGVQPVDPTYVAETGLVYFPDVGARTLTTLNVTTGATTEVGVGGEPSGVTFDNYTHDLFVPNNLASGFCSNVTLVNPEGTESMGQVIVPTHPLTAVYDNATNEMYVPCSGSSTIAAVTEVTLYDVTFEATGMPNGTSWIVNVSGLYQASSNTSASLYLNNGSFNYTAGSYQGYTLAAGMGYFNVSGAPLVVPLAMKALPPVTYHLPLAAEITIVAVVLAGVAGGVGWAVYTLRKAKRNREHSFR